MREALARLEYRLSQPAEMEPVPEPLPDVGESYDLKKPFALWSDGELKAREAELLAELRDAPRLQGGSRRAVPQSVKVAVAARDNGQCQCMAGIMCHGHYGKCGSTEEPHYDHVIPWSKGGSDTEDNLQILCGPCNRRKGAEDMT